MIFLKKIIEYGVRKALVRVFIFIVCKLKGMIYRYILSDNKPCIVASKITQPTQFLGRGVIEIYKAKLGAWPSAGLLDRSGYIEARCPGAIDDRRGGKYDCQPVQIEDDVFISEGVRVLKGVRIGQGSFIGIGSVVVSDVEPMCVYGGVPARKLRSL